MQRILFTVCARAGSKGIPGKATVDLLGKPLIQWTLDQIMAYGDSKHDICVSSNSENIKKIIKNHRILNKHSGLFVYRDRLDMLAHDETPKICAIKDALKYMSYWPDGVYNIVIDLDITNPMRTNEDISNALAIFNSENYCSLVSVTPARRNPYRNQVEHYGTKWIKVVKDAGEIFDTRQQVPQVWDVNSCIYIYDANYLLNDPDPQPINDKTTIYQMPPYTYCDIDEPHDLVTVAALMKEYGYA